MVIHVDLEPQEGIFKYFLKRDRYREGEGSERVCELGLRYLSHA